MSKHINTWRSKTTKHGGQQILKNISQKTKTKNKKKREGQTLFKNI